MGGGGAELQLLNNPSQISVNNTRNVRHKTSQVFRSKENGIITEFETNCKNKKIRDLYKSINEFINGT